MTNPEPVGLRLNNIVGNEDIGAEKEWESRGGQAPCLLHQCEGAGGERDLFRPFWASS